jgi:uncharacterized membrane protein
MSEALVILFVLFGWIILMTMVVVVMRVAGHRPSARDAALEELRARYARAEMSREEYDRQRREISERAA